MIPIHILMTQAGIAEPMLQARQLEIADSLLSGPQSKTFLQGYSGPMIEVSSPEGVVTFDAKTGDVVAVNMYPRQQSSNRKVTIRKPLAGMSEVNKLLSTCTNGHKFINRKVDQLKRGGDIRMNYEFSDTMFGIPCGSQGNFAHISYDQRGDLVSASFVSGVRYLGDKNTKASSLLSIARKQFKSVDVSAIGPFWIRDFKSKESHLCFGFKREKRTVFVSTATKKVISESVDPM